MEAVWVVDSLCYKFGKRDAGHLFGAEVFSHTGERVLVKNHWIKGGI